ncbi:hypothetical protein ACWD6S_37225, partial [Streptomyces zhihengii]
GQRVLLKHTTRTVKAIVKAIPSRLTLDDLSQPPISRHDAPSAHRPATPPQRWRSQAAAGRRRSV